MSRLTATKYLDALADGGFVQKQKIGRSNYYINLALNAILMGNAGRRMTEDQLEQETLGWLADVGYTHRLRPGHRPRWQQRPSAPTTGRCCCSFRLREAIHRLNPDIPPAAREDALKQVLDLGIPVLLSANRHFHRLLVGGVPVQYQKDGETRGDFVRLIDWADPAQQRVAGDQPVLDQGAAPHAPARTSSCSSTACRWC